MTVRLFAYGTLAPGRDAWPVLAPWSTGTPYPDRVAGALYDTGRGYPAAVFGGADGEPAESAVHGYVVELDAARATEALAALDRYEGGEYRRITVRTAGGVEAATYAWIAPLTSCRPVAEGRWDRPDRARPLACWRVRSLLRARVADGRRARARTHRDRLRRPPRHLR